MSPNPLQPEIPEQKELLLPPTSRPLEIYLIRHGETDYNSRQIVQGGGIDSDLNDVGRTQADRFFRAYQHTEFDAVYVSSLKRTHQTVEPFTRIGYKPRLLSGFNEMSWGELEGVYGSEEVRERFREILTAWASGRLDVRVPGGENPVEVWNRSVEAFQTIWNLHPDGGRVLVCSHGRTTRVILSNLLGYGLTQMQLFEHENTGLNLLQTAGKRWVALSLNNTAHL